MSLTGSCFSSESAPRALPSWDSRTRWNNLSGGVAVRRTVGPSGHANSPHPSSREGHHSTTRWISSFLLSYLILHGRHAATTSLVSRQPRPWPTLGVPGRNETPALERRRNACPSLPVARGSSRH